MTTVLGMDIEVGRPPERVWTYLVDWERLDRWMLEARDFTLIGDRREGVGVEAEATIRMAGITTRDRIRVSRWEPPAVLEIQHLGWVKGSGYMELSPTERGTHLFWRETLVPPWGILGRIGIRLFRRAIHRTFLRDLAVLAELVRKGD